MTTQPRAEKAAQFGIFAPNGELISDSLRDSRKTARKDFKLSNGSPRWGDLWQLGFKVRKV
jgi:hypothetical protein